MQIIWFVITFILLSITIIRPPKRIGIKSVTATTRSLGSPSEAESALNILTIGIFLSDIISTVFLQF